MIDVFPEISRLYEYAFSNQMGGSFTHGVALRYQRNEINFIVLDDRFINSVINTKIYPGAEICFCRIHGGA